MPSARPSAFAGGGGILRNQDGTILDLLFTPNNPLAGKGKPRVAQPGQPPQKKSDFKSLFAVLYIQPDGSEKVLSQPVWVGDATKFGITEDGRGLTGDAPLSKSSAWWVFLNSLVNPNGNNGSGFDEAAFPDDDPDVADYSPIRGARVRFGWQKDEKATSKYGKKPPKEGSKGPKDGYDREDLIVTNYYGQVEVDDNIDYRAGETAATEAPAKPAETKATTRPGAATPAAKATKAKKAEPVDVKAYAAEQIVLAVNAAKEHTISRTKLSVKLLTQLQSIDADLRAAVRAFAEKPENLQAVVGVVYDKASDMVTLDE